MTRYLQRALVKLLPAARRGDHEAQHAVAMCYELAFKSKRYAKRWYKQSALHNNRVSQYNLGVIYEKKNKPQKALEWYLKAADSDDNDAQLKVGRLYHMGVEGVPTNPEQAIHWYTKSALNGNAEAMYRLGRIFDREPDIHGAKYWYKKASELNHPKAIVQLGKLYERVRIRIT
jgi:TPR repeat protein